VDLKNLLIALLSLLLITGCLIAGCDDAWDSDVDAITDTCEGFSQDATFAGDYTIDGEDTAADIGELANIECITGGLYISNTALSSLAGLESLQRVGFLKIYNNDALTSLNGLENLTSVSGALRIYNNDALTSLSGLENLISVGGDLSISENDALTSLGGLGNLSELAGVLCIEENDALPACEVENLARSLGRACPTASWLNCYCEIKDGIGTCD
jgi:hypothetical protein